MRIIRRYLGVLLMTLVISQSVWTQDSVPVVVIGGGASGLTASIQAARLGVDVLIVEPGNWLGGMLTSAGVSAFDGNFVLPSGLFGEFRDSLIAHYGSLQHLKTGWVSNVLYEPSVGNSIFKNMVEAEPRISVLYNTRLLKIKQAEGEYKLTMLNSDMGRQVIKAKVVIDATELGDVAARLKVPYDIGMESRHETKEAIAPELANDIIQDLTYVAILKDYGKDTLMRRPENYDPAEFACCCINEHCITPKEPNRMWPVDKMITYGQLPNNKYMINWPIEGNDYYVNIIEMSEKKRIKALQQAKDATMRFIYFMQNELGFTQLYLADDEFDTDDHLPIIPYHRESRRIKGQVRFTLNDITAPYEQQNALYRTCVGVGDYPVDHHHTRYRGSEQLPDLHFHPIPSFGLPMGTMFPATIDNFIVAEKSISVSNLVNGTTRLQPVVMQIGQAAGTIAALAIKNDISVSEVSVREVQGVLLDHQVYLLPYLDVTREHPWFKALQRVGSTGILRGTGKNVGWSNQTWMYADSVLHVSHLDGLKEVYPGMNTDIITDGQITWQQAFSIIKNIQSKYNIDEDSKNEFAVFELLNYRPQTDGGKFIKRGEFAVLVDALLDPFNNRQVDIKGNILN